MKLETSEAASFHGKGQLFWYLVYSEPSAKWGKGYQRSGLLDRFVAQSCLKPRISLHLVLVLSARGITYPLP